MPAKRSSIGQTRTTGCRVESGDTRRVLLVPSHRRRPDRDPGPAIVLIMKNAVIRGRRGALITAAGVFSSDLVWVTASIAGLTALLVAYRPAFEALRFLAAAYLIYLGLRLLLSRGHGVADDETATLDARGPARRGYAEGALSELSNPKTLLIFTTVIPPFLPIHPTPLGVAVYGLTFAVVGFASSIAYALVFSASRPLVKGPRVKNLLFRGSGGVLTAFGVGLAVEGAREL
ncbi:LysE family translocator [Arthrobacter sp. AL08]|uniref:LysE family translocator n=1 Tax=unclassified Arthrobacter TaxID=235627 RepID=UPI00249A4878|nr:MULTISPECIES: LysE family translocator [unclassified Arthrobacter]MDI3243474.1 LysE family translocator [Arthrobacter sp. AL05]MDI3279482.1 LysE family translocator [Arthrobacter sp. AL08]WGZ80823.1 LysE family translocator [Arthrobacter sp. EM1]